MHIAIVLPAYNLAAYVSDAIRSVLDQTYGDWSLTIIDDGSTDPTAEIAGRFPDTRISLIRQANAGVSAARNAGITAAMTRRVPPSGLLFLDGDDWLSPDALARLAGALEAAPWAAAAAGRFVRVGTSPAGCPTGHPTGHHPADHRLGRLPAQRPPQGDLVERLVVQTRFANGGHVLVRAESVRAAGCFRTDLSYGEDWEYWVRIALQGEFVAVSGTAPVLFVRERLDGTYLSRATDPQSYRPAMAAIHGIPGLKDRLGAGRLTSLARRSEAEMAWTIGRELMRHGRRIDGLGWLARSLWGAPSAKRLVLLALSWLRVGPFRPYRPVVVATRR